jgi:hypothetical protein
MLKPMELFFWYSKYAVVEIGIEVIKPHIIIKGPGETAEWLVATCFILLTVLLWNRLCPSFQVQVLVLNTCFVNNCKLLVNIPSPRHYFYLVHLLHHALIVNFCTTLFRAHAICSQVFNELQQPLSDPYIATPFFIFELDHKIQCIKMLVMSKM